MSSRPRTPVAASRPAVGRAIRRLSRTLLLWALLAAGPGLAASSAQVSSGGREPIQPHPEAEEAIDRLKSPFCPGQMLEVCPSPQAARLRDTLHSLGHRGVDSDSLVSMVLATYGEEWRAVPQRQGKGLWAWVVPPAALLLGVAVVLVALRGFRRAGAFSDADPRPGLSEQDRTRVDEALHELEEAERESW